MRKKAFTLRQLVVRALSYDQLHFLIENKVLSQYLVNIENEVDMPDLAGKDWIDEICNHPSRREFISGAFVWGKTPEGFGYWYELYKAYL